MIQGHLFQILSIVVLLQEISFGSGQFFELLNEIQENQRLENNGHRTIFLCLHGDTVMFAFYGPPHTKGTDHIGEAGMKHTKQTMKQTIRKQASKQTGKYTSKQANIQQASKQTNKQIKTNNTTPPNKQINKQTNKQTNTKKKHVQWCLFWPCT